MPYIRKSTLLRLIRNGSCIDDILERKDIDASNVFFLYEYYLSLGEISSVISKLVIVTRRFERHPLLDLIIARNYIHEAEVEAALLYLVDSYKMYHRIYTLEMLEAVVELAIQTHA